MQHESETVGVAWKLTPCRRVNFDPLRLSLGLRAERRRELLSGEDWAEIRRLHRSEGLPIKLIARTLGISRNTVRAALASDGPPKYERKPAGSAVDAFEDAIRAQLLAVPTMPASVIAERVGWTRGMTVFNERVRELRPAYLPPDCCSSLRVQRMASFSLPVMSK